MNNKFIKVTILVFLIFTTCFAYTLIDDLSVWRDTPEDYINIEASNVEYSGKYIYSKILAWIPFTILLLLTIYYFFKKVR